MSIILERRYKYISVLAEGGMGVVLKALARKAFTCALQVAERRCIQLHVAHGGPNYGLPLFFLSLSRLLVQVTGKFDFTVKAVKLSTTAADTLLAQDLPAGMRLLFAAAVWTVTVFQSLC